MIKAKLALCSAILLLCSACATVTIRPDGGARINSTPTFEQSYGFFLGGLIGEANIEVSKICKDKTPTQMQTEFTFVNGLLGAITLGLYSPRTAKVWCK